MTLAEIPVVCKEAIKERPSCTTLLHQQELGQQYKSLSFVVPGQAPRLDSTPVKWLGRLPITYSRSPEQLEKGQALSWGIACSFVLDLIPLDLYPSVIQCTSPEMHAEPILPETFSSSSLKSNSCRRAVK